MRLPDRRRLHQLLEAGARGDRGSRLFDAALIFLIVSNVGANLVETIPEVRARYHTAFDTFEIFSVAIFTLEYALRLVTCIESTDPRFHGSVKGRLRYLVTPAALTDLLAILPFFISAYVAIDLRMLRLLRLLRIFKLAHYFSALSVLMDVIRVERNAFGAAYFVVVLGLLMAASGIYVFEHAAQPDSFGSIPRALWWSVVTMTTVGYGDATPITLGGKVFAGLVILLGIGTIAVPTGILATGFTLELQRRREAYSEAVEKALEDGWIDPQERADLDMARESLGLSRKDGANLERGVPRGVAARPSALEACPHCGELLVAEAKPLPPAGAPSHP